MTSLKEPSQNHFDELPLEKKKPFLKNELQAASLLWPSLVSEEEKTTLANTMQWEQ